MPEIGQDLDVSSSRGGECQRAGHRILAGGPTLSPESPTVHRYLCRGESERLHGPKLLDAIRDRMARGPAESLVSSPAPATPSRPLATDFGALQRRLPRRPDGIPLDRGGGPRRGRWLSARANLDTELSRLREIGGDDRRRHGRATPNPMVAIERAVAKQQFERDHPLDPATRHLALARHGCCPSGTPQDRRPSTVIRRVRIAPTVAVVGPKP